MARFQFLAAIALASVVSGPVFAQQTDPEGAVVPPVRATDVRAACGVSGSGAACVALLARIPRGSVLQKLAVQQAVQSGRPPADLAPVLSQATLVQSDVQEILDLLSEQVGFPEEIVDEVNDLIGSSVASSDDGTEGSPV